MFPNDVKKAMIYDVGQLAPPLCAEKTLLKWGSSERQYFYSYLIYKARSGCSLLPLDRSEYIPLEVKVIVIKQNYKWELFVCLVPHFDLRYILVC